MPDQEEKISIKLVINYNGRNNLLPSCRQARLHCFADFVFAFPLVYEIAFHNFCHKKFPAV
jgi:hypothetical protein